MNFEMKNENGVLTVYLKGKLDTITTPQVEKDMETYAPKISGYATTAKGEYIAESFASWMKGEELADPNLIEIFESLKRE